MGKPVLQYRTAAIFGTASEWKDAKGEIVSSGINDFRIKPDSDPADEVHEFDLATTEFGHAMTDGGLVVVKAPDGRRFNAKDYEVTVRLTRPFRPGYYRSTVSGEMVGWFTSPPECADEWERVEVTPA